ncbi:MAG: hypothetical protein IKI81_02380, partial [Selenomonadaceae bacterium]|nr:hypothetical protein [Selenomonadaceae bacterium]
IIKAMEAGAFNDVIIKRMNELADTKKDIEQAIAVETEALSTYSIDTLRKTLYDFRDGDLEDEQFLRELIQNFVRKVLVFDDEIKIGFYFGEEKTFPLLKRESGTIVRENVTMLHHNEPASDFGQNHQNRGSVLFFWNIGLFSIRRRWCGDS